MCLLDVVSSVLGRMSNCTLYYELEGEVASSRPIRCLIKWSSYKEKKNIRILVMLKQLNG